MVEYLSDDFQYKLSNCLWLNELLKIYPLPKAPSEQCRDAFLKDLLVPYESSDETSSTDVSVEKNVHFGFNAESSTTDLFDIENKLLKRMTLQVDRRSTVRPSAYSAAESKIQAPDIFKLMKFRNEDISSAIGRLAVIFQLSKLRNRLIVYRETWRVTVSIDKSYKMFCWSIHDYIERFKLPNQTYLDIMERELKNQKECYKFRVDINEIIRLVSALWDDVKNKRDICKNSMLLIGDSHTDIEELMSNTEREAVEEYKSTLTTVIQTPRSADPQHERRAAVQTKLNYNDFIYPIEARYRIKWAQTQMEQGIMQNDDYIKEMSKELVNLKNNSGESRLFWDCSQIAFDLQINSLKRRIFYMERCYEERMEITVNKRESLLNKINKVREELAYKKSLLPMFHVRIDEVKNLIAQQEANAFNESLEAKNSIRASRKKSSILSKSKGKMKKF